MLGAFVSVRALHRLHALCMHTLWTMRTSSTIPLSPSLRVRVALIRYMCRLAYKKTPLCLLICCLSLLCARMEWKGTSPQDFGMLIAVSKKTVSKRCEDAHRRCRSRNCKISSELCKRSDLHGHKNTSHHLFRMCGGAPSLLNSRVSGESVVSQNRSSAQAKA